MIGTVWERPLVQQLYVVLYQASPRCWAMLDLATGQIEHGWLNGEKFQLVDGQNYARLFLLEP